MSSSARIHVAYVIGILLAVIVALITVQWGAISELVSYVNFSLAVSSLILALLAIVYSFVANVSQATQVATLQNAATEVAKSAVQISEVTDSLRNRVESIPSAIEQMGKRFDETHTLLTTLTKSPVETGAGALAAGTPPRNLTDLPDRYLANSPLLGLLTLYAASRAKETQRLLEFPSLAEKEPRFDAQFAWGFVQGIAQAGVLTLTDGRVTHLAVPIVEGVHAKIFERASAIDRSLRTATNAEAHFSATMAAVVQSIDSFYAGTQVQDEH